MAPFSQSTQTAAAPAERAGDAALSPRRVREILAAIGSARVAVCGDFCLDAYWILDPAGSEVSIETGLPAKAVARHYYSLGGASNIIANLAALGPDAIRAVGVIGPDLFGRELAWQLERLEVDTGDLVVQDEGFDTVTYCKQYRGGQEEPRVDFGTGNRRSPETDQAVLDGLQRALAESDVVVFNQQFPGSLDNDAFVERANALFAAHSETIVVVDSRHYAERFEGVVYKVNEVEAARLCCVDAEPGDLVPVEQVQDFAQRIHARSGQPVFVTRGDRGILACDGSGVHQVPGIQILGRLDTVGAGDTTLSALACCLAAGLDCAEAARFANLAAVVTVQKLLRTGTASGEEILAVAEDPDYVYQPELAEDRRRASHVALSEIERCCDPDAIRPGVISHAVFDHDGTISTLREGWEAVMEAVMLRAVLGDRYDSADERLYHRVRDRVLDTIEKTTGIQTILQMELLVDLVREFGLVPEEQVLDRFGYKAIFNRSLMGMVDARLDKLQRGELTVEDCTIRGVVGFLERLHGRGVTLYLASGTDHDDVAREAEALGYAHLFTGGIYGSLGDVKKFSKKMVIQRILVDHDLEGPELACFGDGPVEIRECRRHGGIGVGLASDEIRRYGLDPAKRTRLIKAGAHLVAPDYTQAPVLERLLLGA